MWPEPRFETQVAIETFDWRWMDHEGLLMRISSFYLWAQFVWKSKKGSLVFVLGFSRETYLIGCIQIKIYFQELAHMMMEADMSASWRPRREMVRFQSKCCLAWDLERVDVSVWVQRQGKKGCPSGRQSGSSSLLVGGSAFLFYSGLQPIGWGPPMLGRATCFNQSTDWNVKLIPKHPHRHSQSNVWPNVWAPCGPVWLHIKLTITVLITEG